MKYTKVQKEVGAFMGGKVLDLDIIRARDEGEARGEARGERKGRILENIALRREAGWDDAQILEGIVCKFQISIEDAKKLINEASGEVAQK